MKDKVREAVLIWVPTDAEIAAMDLLDRVEMAQDLEDQFYVDIFDDDIRQWAKVDHVVETVLAELSRQGRG